MDTGFYDLDFSNKKEKIKPMEETDKYDPGPMDYKCEISVNCKSIKEEIDEILNTLPPHSTKSVCQEADEIVSGERQGQYGDPVVNTARIGDVATPLLRDYLKEGAKLDGRGVALFMIALKLARQLHKHKRDSIVDAIGYLKILDMIEEDAKKGKPANG